jgi:hypothetical protein
MMSMYMAAIRTYVQTSNWPMVLTYTQKADQLPDTKEDASAAKQYRAPCHWYVLLACAIWEIASII